MNNPWNQGATAKPVAAVNPYLNWTPDQVLNAHLAAKQALEQAKELELALRAEVKARYFADAGDKKGTFNFDLGNGYKLKLVNKENFKVGDNDSQSLDDALDQIAKIGNIGAVMADSLVKFKPELSLTEYNKLSSDDDQNKRIKAIIDKNITVSPGTPTLELVEPKNK